MYWVCLKSSLFHLQKDKYIHSKRSGIDNVSSISKLYSLIAEWFFYPIRAGGHLV